VISAWHVAFGSKCEMPRPNRYFRFALEIGSLPRYSITSSARPTSIGTGFGSYMR